MKLGRVFAFGVVLLSSICCSDDSELSAAEQDRALGSIERVYASSDGTITVLLCEGPNGLPRHRGRPVVHPPHAGWVSLTFSRS